MVHWYSRRWYCYTMCFTYCGCVLCCRRSVTTHWTSLENTVRKLNDSGDYASAQQASKQAKKWSVGTLVGGIVTQCVVLIVVVCVCVCVCVFCRSPCRRILSLH
ncbi:hypothetical protein HOLleu_29426 [Holothuria leucospilota]|uniref:Uncharacterized protein n=1 Tax=Holothuria leucospilota TaxID=206669 RepID=A0A9Q1BNU9_HOLLE|nr:hypothetical protein HOLleu_29426 [Holothuria leucospilota]